MPTKKFPLRVYRSPLGVSTAKKPSPLKAMSVWVEVCLKEPCSKSVYSSLVSTPKPIFPIMGATSAEPKGVSYTPSSFMRRIKSSGKDLLTAISRLKPVVSAFAKLLEIASSRVCWAFMPLEPIYQPRIIKTSQLFIGEINEIVKKKGEKTNFLDSSLQYTYYLYTRGA